MTDFRDRTSDNRQLTQLDNINQALDALQATTHWKPQPGDTLIGKMVAIVPQHGPYGPGHHLIVRTENDNVSLWLTAYLKAQLKAYKAQRGDTVGIRFEGKGVSQRGAEFNRYQVVVVQRQEDIATDSGEDASEPSF